MTMGTSRFETIVAENFRGYRRLLAGTVLAGAMLAFQGVVWADASAAPADQESRSDADLAQADDIFRTPYRQEFPVAPEFRRAGGEVFLGHGRFQRVQIIAHQQRPAGRLPTGRAIGPPDNVCRSARIPSG